jgi:4-hydroxy-3-polyprenylbenzoate decarboxylase
MEAAIVYYIRQHISDRIVSAYCSSAGGGLLLAFLQFRKEQDQDDGVVRRAALAALGTFRMLKQIVLIDEDVDVFNEEDVWWAMTTRFQADRDILMMQNTQGFPLDPSQDPAYSATITSPGLTTKAVFDCTVPFRLKKRFQRSIFYLPDQ